MKVIVVTLWLAAVVLSAAKAGVITSYLHAPPPVAIGAPVVYAAAPAPLVRTPSLDSAVVHSERVGGNFAYSTVEGHAYTALAPVVPQTVVHQAVVHQAVVPAAVAYRAAPPPSVVYAAAAPAKTVFLAR